MFAVQVGLEDPDQGPILDDSWPALVKTEVRVLLSWWTIIRLSQSKIANKRIHLSEQLPFWNGCDEDDRCMPDLSLQSANDLMTRKWVHLY